jgi:hypothetical protein
MACDLPGTVPALLPAHDAAPLLSETARTYASQALSAATHRAYASHLRAWEAWCRARDVPAAPAAPSLVANHLAGGIGPGGQDLVATKPSKGRLLRP